MVFDKIINPRFLRAHPIYAMPVGFFFVILGLYSSIVIFPSQISIVVVALSSMLMLPYVMKIFEFDELDIDIDDTSPGELDKWVRKCLRDGYSPKQIKDNLIRDNLDKPYDLMYDLAGVDENYVKYVTSSNFFTRHWQTIIFYSYLFLGATLAFIVLYGVLTPDSVQSVFENQLDVIRPGPKGSFAGGDLFTSIVSNNLKITFICVFLSLLYGSGAIFILNYNASIAGVMYGSSIRAFVWGSGELYSSLLSYLPHTTIEIFAYLLAAISGGILSKATAGAHPGSIRILMKDGLLLLVFSVVLIFVGGWVEVQVLT